MLEYIAANCASLPLPVILAIDFVLFVSGGLLANLFARNKIELAREPYFAFFALVALAASARLYLAANAIDAVLGGYLWGIVALQIISSVATGFVTGITAVARSRDAFGSGKYAPLAFIPFPESDFAASAGTVPSIGAKRRNISSSWLCDACRGCNFRRDIHPANRASKVSPRDAVGRRYHSDRIKKAGS